jgi:hypothetical protein
MVQRVLVLVSVAMYHPSIPKDIKENIQRVLDGKAIVNETMVSGVSRGWYTRRKTLG